MSVRALDGSVMEIAPEYQSGESSRYDWSVIACVHVCVHMYACMCVQECMT